MAISERGHLFRAPDTYMNKLVVGSSCKGVVSIDSSIRTNIFNIADKLGKSNDELKVIVLERPRNQYIVDELNNLGVQIEMISDGDVAASLRVASNEAHAYMGIGSAPEGVIGATAVKGLDGFFDGQLRFHSDEAKQRAMNMSSHAVDEKINIDKLCSSSNSMFVATGVCDGWIPGVTINNGVATTSSILIDVKNKEIIRITNSYLINEVNEYILGGVK